jgi:hypothetical protein
MVKGGTENAHFPNTLKFSEQRVAYTAGVKCTQTVLSSLNITLYKSTLYYPTQQHPRISHVT